MFLDTQDRTLLFKGCQASLLEDSNYPLFYAYYIWSIALHGAEKWTLPKVAGKCLNVVLE
jgi:hypothetical protein